MRRFLADSLSYARIVLSGLFVLLYSTDDRNQFLFAVAVLGLAVFTDHVDGRVARRLGVASKRGSILDGLADRAMYISLTLAFVAVGRIHPAIAWLIIFREVMLYGIRLMRRTEWYPITGKNRRLALLHGATLQLWLVTYLIAEYVNLFHDKDYYPVLWFAFIQFSLLLSTLVVAYYYLAVNIKAVRDDC